MPGIGLIRSGKVSRIRWRASGIKDYQLTKQLNNMEFKKQLITPSIAKKYLEANVKNRRIRTPIVTRYANDMTSGKWKEDTAEVIKISKTGIILDGQHRLAALIKANVSISFHVATSLDDNVFDVLDTGSNRSAGDIFLIQGIKNQSSIPSIISTYHNLKMGTSSRTQQKNLKLTNAALLIEYNKREMFWQNVFSKSSMWYLSYAKILPKSLIGGFYCLFYDINNDDSESFFNQLCTGREIKNKAIFLLRQKLMQDKMAVRKIPFELRSALIIKSWNYFRSNNDDVKLLKFNTVSEEYPKPI